MPAASAAGPPATAAAGVSAVAGTCTVGIAAAAVATSAGAVVVVAVGVAAAGTAAAATAALPRGHAAAAAVRLCVVVFFVVEISTQLFIHYYELRSHLLGANIWLEVLAVVALVIETFFSQQDCAPSRSVSSSSLVLKN